MFLIIVIILLLIYFIILQLDNRSEHFVSESKLSMGASIENLELAYNLCSKHSSKDCKKYVSYYEKLRNTFKRLKNEYCSNYPDMCKKLNAV